MQFIRKHKKTSLVIFILVIIMIFVFEIPTAHSAGDPPFRQERYLVRTDTTEEPHTLPDKEEIQITIEPEEVMTIKETKKVEDNKNISIPDKPEEYAKPEEAPGSTEDINNEVIENIPEETIPEVPEINKLTPQGEYTTIDFSIYTPEEAEVLKLVLSKIEENKNTDKDEELIYIDYTLSRESYYKIASFFYVYYGQKRAVDETFDLVNHSEVNMETGEEIRKYMIRMRYEDIREFEKDLDLVKAKTDEILSSFESGPDVYILYQISEYLRNNIIYTEGKYDIKSALIDGKTVCNGYALAFNILANRAGIKSDMCIGEVPEGMHAWNRVLLDDGTYAFYDTTAYDTNNGNPKYILSPEELHTSTYTINDYTTCWFGE